MPIKYPCIECKKPVKCNQLPIFCNLCKLWIHFKCSTLTEAHFDFLATNVDLPFNCHKCRPLPQIADGIPSTSPIINVEPNTNYNSLHNDSSSTLSSDIEFSDADSSDFSFESTNENECDSDLRGLDFTSLPSNSLKS